MKKIGMTAGGSVIAEFNMSELRTVRELLETICLLEKKAEKKARKIARKDAKAQR